MNIEDDSYLSTLWDIVFWGVLLVLVGIGLVAAGRFCWKNWAFFQGSQRYILQEEDESQASSFQGMGNYFSFDLFYWFLCCLMIISLRCRRYFDHDGLVYQVISNFVSFCNS